MFPPLPMPLFFWSLFLSGFIFFVFFCVFFYCIDSSSMPVFESGLLLRRTNLSMPLVLVFFFFSGFCIFSSFFVFFFCRINSSVVCICP
ncbi:Arylsulfatase [Fusarium oxysporum f. sp. albedinis]|nr:Arylsulfatase [Fusarium oxysporum f. sp. albedinis]